jgi:hypothetical protein
MRKHDKCEWCGQPMDAEKHIITGLSHEHICMNCAKQCDELGYDINEM